MIGMDSCAGAKCAALMMRMGPRDFCVVRACTEFVLSLTVRKHGVASRPCAT